jgi:mannosidase alpha-like ER degradation enhancer 3
LAFSVFTCQFSSLIRNEREYKCVFQLIFTDNTPASSADVSALFAMSGDGRDDVQIPMVFLFDKEAQQVFQAMEENPDVKVLLGYRAKRTGWSI